MSLPLPSEAQARVVKFSQSGPQKGVLKVIAPAGSGKTTTLLMVTLANAGKKILYVAFNREIAQSAKVKFNGHADALTINAYVRRLLIQESTAYERRIALFEEKSRDGFWGNSSRVEKFYYDRIKEIEPKTFDLEETDESEPVNMDVAALTLRRILGFAKSSAVTMEEYLKDKTDKDPLLDQLIEKAAVKFWEQFLSNACLWPLDFLMQVKLAQTSGILERALGSYAIVLFDEAQDASDVVLGAMKNADTKIIYVGDPHQHIYGFTGTVDAFEKIDGPVAELTESYRFGQAIADVCNKIILKKGVTTQIIGLGKKLDDKSEAVLTRSNVAAISSAIDLWQGGKGRSVHFMAGIMKSPGNLIDYCHIDLGNRHKIKSKWLLRFNDLEHAKNYYKKAGDSEQGRMIALAEKRSEEVITLFNYLSSDSFLKGDAEGTVITVATTHQAKGLEWSKVTIADDFQDALSARTSDVVTGDSAKLIEGDKKEIDHSEINLLYVAVSRAMNELVLSPKMEAWIGLVQTKVEEQPIGDILDGAKIID